jgi:hypothetical protein
MSWLRLYTEIMDDPKVMQLEPRLFKTWMLTLCMAKNNNGYLPSMAFIAFKLRLREDIAKQHIDTLIEAGLIDVQGDQYQPHNWSKRQYESDTSKERTQRYRDRKKQGGSNGSVTSQERHGDALRVQSTEYREENTLTSVKETAQAPVAVPAPTPARPPRFVPPTAAEVRDHAASAGYTIDAERFCDYYGSKGWVVGKAPMKNWKLAVANWSRSESSMTAITRPPPKQSAADIVRDKLAREAMEARNKNAN